MTGKLLFLNEVADRLRVHYSTARDFVLSGKLQGIRLGGRRKIQVSEEDLDAFIQASTIIGPETELFRETQSEPVPLHRRGKMEGLRPNEWRQRFRKGRAR